MTAPITRMIQPKTRTVPLCVAVAATRRNLNEHTAATGHPMGMSLSLAGSLFAQGAGGLGAARRGHRMLVGGALRLRMGQRAAISQVQAAASTPIAAPPSTSRGQCA